MATRFGRQPAYIIIQRKQRTIMSLAEELGLTPVQLYRPIAGRTRPNDVVRQDLPKALGVPLEELFTAEALADGFCTGRGPKPVQR